MRHVVEDPGGEAVISGEVVEFDPPRTLAYTWSATFHSKPDHTTLVRWELVPNKDGTLVKMTHSRLKPLSEGATYADGWPGVMNWLKQFAETQNQ
jgi:uncharacterized protein YndB with AHSA1/START domain